MPEPIRTVAPPVMKDEEMKLESGWKEVDQELKNRYQLILEAIESLKKVQKAEGEGSWDSGVLLKLAATDVFVEKAQRKLTSKATALRWLGILASVLLLSSLGFAAWRVAGSSLKDTLGEETLNGYSLTFVIVKALSFGGFVFTAVYFLGELARALLHESTVLLNRRHALRFGRLSVYMKRGDVDIETLQKIFQWNDEFTTAFKDIQPQTLKSAGLGQMAELPPKVIKELAGLVENLRKLKS